MLEIQPLMQVSSKPFSFETDADIQQSSRKDCRDAYFPMCGHLQAPDFDNGEEQYREV